MGRAALCVALAYILSFFDLFKLPFGGGVSLESLPLMILSWSSGPVVGFTGGICLGLTLLTKSSAIIHPIQFLLDYPLAFSSFFLIGFCNKSNNSKTCFLLAVLSFALRSCFHILSGILFCGLFIKNVPENLLIYAIEYNLSFMIPTAIINIFLFNIIIKRLKLQNK